MNDLHLAESIDSYIQKCKEHYNNMLARKSFAYTTDYNSYFNTIHDFLLDFVFQKHTMIGSFEIFVYSR